jgi:type IV secretion system protein VirB4
LNDRQIDILAHARPKREYYYQSRLGCRLFDLGLGPVALAFAAASTPEDQRAIDEFEAAHAAEDFAAVWLARRGLDWAARLLEDFSGWLHTSPEPPLVRLPRAARGAS